CIGLTSLRTEAVLLQLNASPPPCRSTRPGCEWAGSVFWFDFASHRGGAPTIERATPPRRSTRPGCERTGSVYWFDFASHRGGAPTSERATPPCRSTRPGCEWGRLGVLVRLRFAPRRCSYNRTHHPTP